MDAAVAQILAQLNQSLENLREGQQEMNNKFSENFGDVQENFGDVKARLRAVEENVHDLASVVLKGNGTESLLVRTARIEETAAKIMMWIDKEAKAISGLQKEKVRGRFIVIAAVVGGTLALLKDFIMNLVKSS